MMALTCRFHIIKLRHCYPHSFLGLTQCCNSRGHASCFVMAAPLLGSAGFHGQTRKSKYLNQRRPASVASQAAIFMPQVQGISLPGSVRCCKYLTSRLRGFSEVVLQELLQLQIRIVVVISKTVAPKNGLESTDHENNKPFGDGMDRCAQ